MDVVLAELLAPPTEAEQFELDMKHRLAILFPL